MDQLKVSDYINICRLCLCKANKTNKLVNTEFDKETINLVLETVSIKVATKKLHTYL